MPPAAPLIAAAAISAGVAFATGATLLTAGIIFGGTIALGLLQQALVRTPKGINPDRTSLVRQPITERRFPFGELVLGGVLTEYESTDKNQYHHMVVTLGDAPTAAWDGIDIVWLNDEPIFNSEIDGSGNVTAGKFSGNVRIKKHLGGPSQTADSDLTSEVTRLDSNFKGVGIAYLYVRIDWSQELFPNGLPSVRAWCRTNTYEDVRDSTRKFGSNAALILREYLTDTSVGLGFDAADLDDTQSQAAANTCDEIADAKPVGHAVAAVDTGNDELDLAVAGTGAPLRVETGDRVEIFTDGTAPGGLSAGTSYYVIVERIVGASWEAADETTISLSAGDYTAEAATAITAGDVDTAYGGGILAGVKLASSFDNAMSRTAVTITSAGTGQHVLVKTGEPRYAAAGVFEDGRAPKDQIEDCLTAMAGRLIWTGGSFRIVPGAWPTPMAEVFDESDLWGPLVVRTRHSRQERFNSVRGLQASLIALGEQTDYPSVIDSTYVSNDGGTRVWKELELPWTSRPATAQRIAKIALARHRREFRVEYPTSIKGLLAVPGSVIKVTNARRSWAEKTFEVLEQEDMEIAAEVGGQPLQGVKLVLAELDSTAFDFTPSTEETVKAPKAVLRGGNPFTASAPSGVTLASGDSELFVKADGTIVSRIQVTWTTEDAFAVNDEVQWKKTLDATWQKAGLVQVGDGQIHIWDVEDGISYDVRVRSINAVGVASDWTQASAHQVVGKTAAPPDVSSFVVTRMADGTRRFSWVATPPADVRAGGGFKIKYVSGAGGVWSGMSEIHTGLLDASPYETNDLAAGTYTFGIKMVDSSGNESDNAVIIEATLGDPRLRDVLVSRDERQLGWPGTLVDCFISPENTLEATGSGDWSSLPATWDALADTWREIVASNSPITYTTPEIDLGADVTVTPIVSVDPSANATVTMQTGTDSDGGAVGSFVATATVTARYIKIRVSEASTDPYIQSIVTLLDAEVQTEDYEDVDTSAVSSGVFETIATGHFKLATRGNTAAITSATIRAFQNAGSGWTWELLSKSTTITGDSEPAAEFKIYSGGTLTDATIDAEIKGPKK